MTDKEILSLIEFYVSVNEDPSNEEAHKIISDVYRAAHSYRQEHSCYYVHKIWREEAKNLWLKVRQSDFI